MPSMRQELNGRSIAILATDGVERVELEQPSGAVLAAGARTELLALHDGTIEARQADMEPAGRFTVDRPVSEASVDDYDGLLLPGGTVNQPLACRPEGVLPSDRRSLRARPGGSRLKLRGDSAAPASAMR